MEGSKINSLLSITYMCEEKENQFFDRKSAKKDIKELANPVAGFANASGGTLVIGISDDGKIEGFEECESKYNLFLVCTITFGKKIEYFAIINSYRRKVNSPNRFLHLFSGRKSH